MIIVSVNYGSYRFTIDSDFIVTNNVSIKEEHHIEVKENLSVTIYRKLLKTFHPDLAPQYGEMGRALTRKICEAKEYVPNSIPKQTDFKQATADLIEIMERLFSDSVSTAFKQEVRRKPEYPTITIDNPISEAQELKFNLADWLYHTQQGRIPRDRFIATIKAAYQVARQKGITAQFEAATQYPKFPESVWQEAYSRSNQER